MENWFVWSSVEGKFPSCVCYSWRARVLGQCVHQCYAGKGGKAGGACGFPTHREGVQPLGQFQQCPWRPPLSASLGLGWVF